MAESPKSYQVEVLTQLAHRDVLLVAVGVILQDERGFLLLQQQADGLWHLPGGHVEPGESLAEAARRETWEETGLTPLHLQLWTVVSGAGAKVERQGTRAYYITALFRSTAYEGTLQAGEESTNVGWYPLDALPSATAKTVQLIAQALWDDVPVPVNVEL